MSRLKGSQRETNYKHIQQTGHVQLESSTPLRERLLLCSGLDDNLSDSILSLQLSDSELPCVDDVSPGSLDLSWKITGSSGARKVLVPQLEFVYKLTLQSEIIIESAAANAQQSVDKQAIDTVTYNCIGGLEKQICEMRQLIELPLRAPHLFSAAGKHGETLKQL